MPDKKGRFSDKELAFAEAYARLNDREAAEREAHYPPGGGYAVLRRPEIQARIDELNRAKMQDLRVMCISWALNVMRDPAKPDTIKRDIFKEAIKENVEADRLGQDEANLTPEQLTAAIAAMEAELKRRGEEAKDVTPAIEGQSGGLFD